MKGSPRPSVVVIGAGVAGLATAMTAAELGCRVTVLERRHAGSGSSALSAGIFNINSTELLQVEIRVRTRALLDDLEQNLGLHLSRIGYMRLGKKPQHTEMFRDVIALQRELGVEPSQLIEPEAARELVPHLRIDDLESVIYNPRDGHMDGPLVCGALAERATAAGAEIRVMTPVTGHTRLPSGHRLTTPSGDFEADVVVNAAGPWAERIGEVLGAPLPLVNQLHEVVKVKLPPVVDYTVPMVQEYIPGESEAGYFRQDGPDSMIAGMHTYAALEQLGSADPDDYQKAVEWATWEAVAQHVSSRLPVDGLGFETGWTGLYPISADGEFVVGPYESDETVFACGGLGGQGLTAGLAVGPAVGEWIVLGAPETIPGVEQFRPDRPGLAAAASGKA